MKRFFIYLTVVIIFIITFSCLFNFYIKYYPITTQETFVEIPPNINAKVICKILESKKVIPTYKILYFIIKITNSEKNLKAGEYKFEKGLTYPDILKILIKGRVVLYRTTIPEGLNIYEIAEILKKRDVIDSEKDFINFCFDKNKIKKFLNNNFSMEGYLFPDTYKFNKHENISKVITVMNENFIKKVLPVYKNSGSYMTLNEVIILASIIQKETYNKPEMPVIASVFYNRLKRGMRLQSDPTIIYGLWGEIKGRIKKSDLKKYTDYNTYLIYGLPPTPISNPGLAAIKAALNPAKTKYLYFVATKRGYHVFAKTYKEHLRNIRKYLRVR